MIAGQLATSASRHRATWLPSRPVMVAVLAGTVALALHLLVLAEGPHWRSPLLAGEWLFNVVFVIAIFTYCLAIGRRFCRPFVHLGGDTLADGLATLGLGFGLLSTAILLAGFLRLYYPPLFLLGFALLTIFLRHELAAILDEAASSLARWRDADLPTAPERGQRLMLAVLAVTLLYVLMRSMLPLTDWDAVAYHVSSVKIYLEAHAVIALPDMPLAGAPSAEEMLFLAGLAAHTDGLGKVLNLGFTVLLGLSVFSLGRHLGGPAAGWHAVLLLLTSFWVLAVLPLTLTDFASAFFLVASLRDAAAWADSIAFSPTRAAAARSQRLLARCGLLMGLAAACKLSSLPALPALVAAATLAALLFAGTTPLARLWRACRAGALVGAAALLPLAPWLLKSWYFFSAPLYPYMGMAVTNPAHDVTVDQVAPSSSEHLRWIVTSLGDFVFNHGSALAVLLLPALFILRKPGQRIVQIFFAIAIVLWFLYVPYFEPPRYFLGLSGVAGALGVATLYAIWPSWRPAQQARQIGMLLYLLSRAWPNLLVSLGAMSGSLLGQVVRGDISHYDYLTLQMRPYAAEEWVNAHMPAKAEIVTVGVLTGYYLDRPYLNDWYGSRLSRLKADADLRHAEIAGWCRAGVSFAVFDRGDGSPDRHGDNGVQPLTAFAWIHVAGLHPRALFSANGVDVLSIAPCGAVQSPAVSGP